MNILELAILKKMVGGGGGSGTDNYNDLSNLPQINGETLAGNKTAENLGLQDALTFDSAPTEDSTNPVESGGVYNALAGKQDNLTFDGVYNASTNKAATESTVTNAIAGLDVSAFSVDADETISSISETDGKVSVTKQDIAIASNQVVAMTGYTKPSSAPATPAIQQGDTANAAIGKLEYKADVNQSNILYVADNGGKNKFNCDPIVLQPMNTVGTWSGNAYTVSSKTYTINNGEVTVSGGEDQYNTARLVIFKGDIPAGTKITGCPAGGATSGIDSYCIGVYDSNDYFVTADIGNGVSITNDLTNVTVCVTRARGAMSSSLVFKPMLCTVDAWDISHEFVPCSLPNYDLTRLEAEDRAELVELVDSGAKQLVQIHSATNGNSSATPNSNGYSVTISGAAGAGTSLDFGDLTVEKTGDYVFAAELSGTLDKILVYDKTASQEVKRTDVSGNFIISLNSTHKYVVGHYNNSAQTLNGTVSVLVCTKAAFGVSNKFVPFGNDPFYQVPINHNMIYRGRNLGASLTDAQHTALSSGNFTDLYLGDYWTKTVTIPAGTYTGGDGEEVTVPAQTNITLKAVIADFDTFYAGYASTYAGINTHHAAVIVTGFSNVVWNKTNSTAGGYVNSLIHKWLVGSVLPQIETWFGSAKVLSHQKLLTNAITGDAASGWAWSSQKISLLSECQLYGMKVWGGSKATNGAYEPGEAFKKLDVFNHIDANLLFGNRNIWCRDIASAVWAARLLDGGYADGIGASHTWVAPAALILLS